MIGQLRQGVSKIVEDPQYTPANQKLAVADVITGYGVAESVVHYYDLYQGSALKGKRVIVQGWGNVASATAYYLSQKHAKIVGIIDLAGGVFSKEGLTLEEIVTLFVNRKGNKLNTEKRIPFQEMNELIWDLEADIFIPGAASKLVTRNQIDRLINKGLKVVACGANVPFVDDEVFFGPTAKYTDDTISLIPDFIANSGMARVFAYLMQPDVSLTDDAIFSDVSLVIRQALQEVKAVNTSATQLSTTALTIALKKLMGAQQTVKT